MLTKTTTKTRLILAAFALPAASMAFMATPASAQSETTAVSAQQIAEGFIAAMNGSGGERASWARDNLLSDGSYRMRLLQVNRIARRTGELTLLDVAEVSNGMVLQVRDSDGRTKAISIVMDDRNPDKVLGVGMRGV